MLITMETIPFLHRIEKQNQLTNNLVRLLYPSYRDFFRMAVFVYICLLAFPLHPACSVLLELLE